MFTQHTHVLLGLALAVPCAAQVCRTHSLVAADPQADGRVGTSIGLSGDTLACGGPQVDFGLGLSGAVYVWRQVGTDWLPEQKIQSTGFNQSFGRALALHGDRLVIGGNFASNLVWLHRRSGAQWTSAGALSFSGASSYINFGYAVACEGEWIAVGAPQAFGVPPVSVRTGAVSLFRDQAGVLSEVAQLRPPTLVGLDDVGIALAMRASVLVVGTAVGNGPASATQGRAVVYRIVANAPVLEAELLPVSASPGYTSSPLIGSGATFGQVVATDGVRIAVGDVQASDGASIGRVDVWVHQAGSWVHEGFVKGLPGSCGFGDRIAIEGDELIVGQSCGDRVHHFRRIGGSWLPQHATPSQSAGTFRVQSLALENGVLAIGSPLHPAPNANAGRVGLYELGAGSMPYGAGLAGSGGFVPELSGVGCPRVGQPYSVRLTAGLGGGIAVLAFGDAPAAIGVFGGTLWTAPIVLSVTVPLSGGLAVPGDGSFQVPITLSSPALVGMRVCCQAGVLDPAAPQSFALSNGLEIVVGS
jgi:hypothetical protein